MTDERPEEQSPVSQLHLRDRLLATLIEFNVDEPVQAVEAVCAQLAGWMNATAEQWFTQAAVEGDVAGFGVAASRLLQGLADGIQAGAPPGITE
jgi:hypothetical protein